MEEHAWFAILAEIINGAHTTAPHELTELVDRALRPVDLTAEIYLVDLAQQLLVPLRPTAGSAGRPLLASA